MSCVEGGEVDCTEVLDQVYEYLNGELNDDLVAQVRRHLDECSPCLQEFGLEEAVRKLVAKSCACRPAPERLRLQVLTRITEVRVSASLPAGSASATLAGATDAEDDSAF